MLGRETGDRADLLRHRRLFYLFIYENGQDVDLSLGGRRRQWPRVLGEYLLIRFDILFA
jgi:hypothetical protein